MASLPLALLKARGSSGLVRLVLRLLRALKIQVSLSTLLFAVLGVVGALLLFAAWSRNRKDAGARLWPLTLPALAVTAVVGLALLNAVPPTVDLSNTESGHGALEMARATPPPVDPLAAMREYIGSGMEQRVSIGFYMAGESGEAAAPLVDLMMHVLTTDSGDAERRVAALLKVIPADKAESVLRLLSMQGTAATGTEALCLLGERGAMGSAEAMADVLGRTDLTAEDEPALRRIASCAAKLPLHLQIVLLPHLRGLIERMCRPPHDAENAWSGSGSSAYGDPLASMGLFREAMKALWAMAPSESTKAFAWDLLENAPFKTRNNRRVAINEITMRMPARALP